jgi:hypothetical protein
MAGSRDIASQIRRIVDAGPQLRADDGCGVIDRHRQDSPPLQLVKVVTRERRAAANQECRLAVKNVPQRGCGSVGSNEHGETLFLLLQSFQSYREIPGLDTRAVMGVPFPLPGLIPFFLPPGDAAAAAAEDHGKAFNWTYRVFPSFFVPLPTKHLRSGALDAAERFRSR